MPRSPLLALVLFLLLPAMGLTLAGCGQQDETDNGTDSDTEQQEQQSEDAEPGSAAQDVEPVELNEQAQAAVDRIVQHYLTVAQQLADDELEGVADEMDQLHTAAHDLMDADAEPVVEQAGAVAEPVHEVPENLDQAREILKPLSEAVIQLTRLAPPSDDAAPALYAAHCPMAEGDWLQTSDQIVNPYMGQQMLQCGSIEQTLKADAAG